MARGQPNHSFRSVFLYVCQNVLTAGVGVCVEGINKKAINGRGGAQWRFLLCKETLILDAGQAFLNRHTNT